MQNNYCFYHSRYWADHWEKQVFINLKYSNGWAELTL